MKALQTHARRLPVEDVELLIEFAKRLGPQ
jgi:hypothetical protein